MLVSIEWSVQAGQARPVQRSGLTPLGRVLGFNAASMLRGWGVDVA